LHHQGQQGLFWENIMRKSLIATAILLAGLSLAACNTISGAGRDVSSVGKAVSNTANDVKN